MAEKPLLSGQNAFPRSFSLGFWGGICIEKCVRIFDSGTGTTIFGTPEKLKPTIVCMVTILGSTHWVHMGDEHGHTWI